VPPLPGAIEVVRDAVAGRGPLQGLAAGLDALQGRAEAAYLSSCDVPLLRPPFVRLLIDLLGDQAICVPDAGGYRQPLAAVYRLTVAPEVQRLLGEGLGRMGLLFERVATRFVEADTCRTVDPQLQSLRNVNTLEEYQAALAACQDYPTPDVDSG
jgi:molybdopterin-guanine dinucleotide biosynthesis protein A